MNKIVKDTNDTELTARRWLHFEFHPRPAQQTNHLQDARQPTLFLSDSGIGLCCQKMAFEIVIFGWSELHHPASQDHNIFWTPLSLTSRIAQLLECDHCHTGLSSTTIDSKTFSGWAKNAFRWIVLSTTHFRSCGRYLEDWMQNLHPIFSRRENQGSNSVRYFRVPSLNFSADDYIDIINWQSCEVTSPSLLEKTYQGNHSI